MYSFCSIRILVIAMCLGIVCDSARLGTKVKRKVDTNSVGSEIENGVNITEKQKGRGFLPTGGIFTLGKVLNFFPVGGERECKATKGSSIARSGICLNPYDCRQRDGQAGGDCARGLGVCCIFEVTCGGVIKNNLTYFISPGFPELWDGTKDCRVTVDKAHAGIMQLKIDFVHFNIGQPNRTTGDCDQDVMTLGTGGKDPNQFKMCGQNHGQHIYYTLSTSAETRESEDDLPASARTQLIIRPRGFSPRLWLMRIAQMPLANSAPNNCLQYFTDDNGMEPCTITTFNYAVNGRHLANQDYNTCVRKNPGFCAIRYQPCDERSFRIGPGNGTAFADTYVATGPGSEGGPGTGFYGPDGSFVPGPMDPMEPSAPEINVEQQGEETENDPVIEDGMLPADNVPQMDEMEGSGAESQFADAAAVASDVAVDGAATAAGVPPPSMASRIWSFMWPSWLWDDGVEARTWGFWSSWFTDEEETLIQGYDDPAGFRVYGRLGCQDRISIPCDNEEFITNSVDGPGTCDPHHCGTNFCPGLSFRDCRVQTSVSPFTVSMHFGEPQMKTSAEDNIGACLMYTQLPCEA